MILKRQFGREVTCQHHCAEERKGQVMSEDELLDFTIQCLMDEYEKSGVNVVRLAKKAANEADFCFVDAANNTINVLVICKNAQDADVPDVDTSWMIEEYRRTGAIPRLIVAEPVCVPVDNWDFDTPLCGGSFFFWFCPISLLPDEKNAPLDEFLFNIDLAEKYAEAWRHLDASIVEPYLDKDFHYGSCEVFDKMPSRYEYLNYFRGKLATIKETGSRIDVSVGYNYRTGQAAVLLHQPEYRNKAELVLTTKDGRITSANMERQEKRFKVVDSEEGKCIGQTKIWDDIQTDGRPEEYFASAALKVAKPWRVCRTEVATENLDKRERPVCSLLCGEGDLKSIRLLALSEFPDMFSIVSSSPIAKGKPTEVKIEKVVEHENHVEASIVCSVGVFRFTFSAKDYYCNKNMYCVGQKVSVDLSALGLTVEAGKRGIQLEGQQAIDWLSKIGEKPAYDEKGEVYPIRIGFEKPITFISKDSDCLYSANFQSNVGSIETVSAMGIDHFKTDVTIYKGTPKSFFQMVTVPLYFLKDSLPNVKEGDSLRGTLLMMGTITGRHDYSNIKPGRHSLMEVATNPFKNLFGEMASRFEDFMNSQDFSRFSNLMWLLKELPMIKIRDGYEFDAFKHGDNEWGSIFRTYCHKVGAVVPFDSEGKDGFNDEMIIHGYHSSGVGRIPNALSYFHVPFTEAGIIQAWLLDKITEFMPKEWHGNTFQKFFVFDTESIDRLFPEQFDKDVWIDGAIMASRQECKDAVLSLDREQLLPSITIDGDTAMIEYTYWNDWNGMISVLTKVVKDGDSVRFIDLESTVLVKFSSSIYF